MKKALIILSTFLLLTMLIVGMSITASAEDAIQSGTWGKLSWSLNETTGELSITGRGSMSNFSLSSSTSAWLKYKSSIKSVVIGDGVTSIGSYAFYNCTGLTSVTIPDSVTSIGSYAFSGCTRLKDVYITDVEAWLNISFGDTAARPNYYGKLHILDENGNEVTEIVIPDGVTSIGYSAFENCTGLTSITIPDSVTSIGYAAFRYCTGLTSITIPHSVTSIGSHAFYGCTRLKDAYITDFEAWLNISLGSEYASPSVYGKLHILDENGKEVTEIVIPNSVTSIGDYAFYNCTGLASVTIPNSVTKIGDEAFYNCTGLTSITIPDSVTSIGDSAFCYCAGLPSITIGNSVTSIGSNAFYWCTGLTSITIPDSVTSIGYRAFYECTRLANVTIGNGVTSIGSSAFEDCTRLTSITIPDSVTSIGSSAFSGCTGLTSITIPDSVTSIGSQAFYWCMGLKDIYITDVEAWLNISLGDTYARPNYYGKLHILDENGNEVTEIVIPDGVTSIGDYAFKNCKRLTSITIPNSVTSIDNYAFSGCTGLIEVVNNSSLNLSAGSSSNGYVAYYALEVHSGESKLVNFDGYLFYTYNNVNYLLGYVGNATDLTLPANFNGQRYEIYEYAFYYKNDITSITIPESVRKIPQYAFGEMKDLKKVIFNAVYCADMTYSPFGDSQSTGFTVEFGARVAKIPAYLFSGCNITSITFAENCICTDIGDYAFYRCNDIVSFTLPDYVTTIGSYAFYNCYNLTSFTVGSSVNSIGNYAFQYCYKLAEVINKSSLNIRASSGSSSYGYIGAYAVEVHNGESKLINQNGYIFYPYGSGFLVNYVGNDTELALPADFNGNSTYTVWNYAFYQNDNITSVVIPKDVVSIGNYAFAYCDNLESVTMGDGLASIQSYAFAYNDKLTNVTFGEGFPGHGLSIGSNAFYDCDGLVTIELPSTTSSIGSSAFYGCGKLEHISIGDDAASIGSSAFSGCSSLKSIKIGANITSIGSSAFSSCTNLKIVYINSPTIAVALTSATACGNLINVAETVLVEKSITNLATFVFAVFYCTEELNYEGTDYISYSMHSHTWEICSLEGISCDQSKFIGSKCSICGALKGATAAPTEHTHSTAVVENKVNPNCTIDGSYDSVVYCSVCKAELSREKKTIDKLGHDYSTEWTVDLEPTCTEVGSKSHHCSRCDDKADVTEIPANGHTFGDWYETKAPTCTETGTDERECSVCHEKETRTTEAKGHTNADAVEENRVEPKCTVDGSYDSVVYCSVCKVELSREKKTIDKLGHDHSAEWTVDLEPTCTEVGIKSHHCSRCDDKADITEIPANGHTNATAVEENRVEPDCTEDGSYDSVVYCSVCKAELSREKKTIDKLGHDHSAEWTVDLEPTCTEVGSKSHHCSRCDDKTDITEVPANGHTYKDSVTDPTCLEKGYTTHICEACGDSYTDSEVDAVGHIYDNETDADCNACGDVRTIETTPTDSGNTSKSCGGMSFNAIGLMLVTLFTISFAIGKKKKI